MRRRLSVFTVVSCSAVVLMSQLAWAAADVPAQVREVAWTERNGASVLRIDVDRPPVFEATAHGDQLVIDVMDAQVKHERLQPVSAMVRDVRVKQTVRGSRDIARVQMQLGKAVSYDVTASKNAVIVSLRARSTTSASIETKAASGKRLARLDGIAGRPQTATDARLAQAEDDEDEDEGEGEEEGATGASTDDGSDSSTSTKMTYIGFRNSSDSSVIFARMNVKDAAYQVKREGQNLLVLEVDNASIPLRNNKNYLDTTHFNAPVKMITPTEVDGETSKIRIVIEMKEDVPYQDSRDGVDIVLTFKK